MAFQYCSKPDNRHSTSDSVTPSTVLVTYISSTTCLLYMCLMHCTVYSASLSVRGVGLHVCCTAPMSTPRVSSATTRASSALALACFSAASCRAAAADGAAFPICAPGFLVVSTCKAACACTVALYASSLGNADTSKGESWLPQEMCSTRPSYNASKENGISVDIKAWKPLFACSLSCSTHCSSTLEYKLILSRTSSSLSFCPNCSKINTSRLRLGHRMAIFARASTAAALTRAFSKINRL
mmetsp:Transcript_61776/g.188638  ORF Transcript_61776/g.188638 Transcript_61776/m.188638 type:complete len:241 (+) Transcript_61776:720-1442(+)